MLLEKEQQHLDKTQNWRRKIDPLMMWISSAETRLNTHFEIAPDLDTVKKQKRELEVHFTPAFLTGFFFSEVKPVPGSEIVGPANRESVNKKKNGRKLGRVFARSI